jgi:acetyl esterase/lipase
VDRRQSLDLYVPKVIASAPPLLVFLHGGFWSRSDDQYRIGPGVAESLVKSGVAVALVRYRLAPTHRHPAQAKDVAAALSHLIRRAQDYGYDPKRIYLGGHSAGAHLAALVGLDPAYLGEQGLLPSVLAGVVTISGIYDLASKARVAVVQKESIEINFGENSGALRAASPLAHVRPNSLPFLILNAASDFPGLQLDGRRFAEALRGSGNRNVDHFTLPDQNHISIMQLNGKSGEARALILDFLKVEALPTEFAALVEAKRRWLHPPFSTEPFWRDEKLIRSYPVDKRFVQSLATAYGHMKYELLAWPLDQFYAIDLFAYLDSLPSERVGKGDHLVITNLRNEKQYWKRQHSELYRPVIVIGIDDEKNLFRMGVFSHAFREYSWKPGGRPPLMARPVGAFIYFLDEPPPRLWPHPSQYALTQDSFKLVEEDPLGALAELPRAVYEALTFKNGCVYCHSFRGIGSRSHHILSANGAPHGGFALALETYPLQVWKEFMFNQTEVAKKMGTMPNVVDDRARQSLYDLVVESRERVASEQMKNDQ